MNRLLLVLSVFLGGALWVLAEAQVGKQAPEFNVTDINGKRHSLSGYKGKVVVLEAYNLDCPYSRHHYQTGSMQELQDYAASKGVVWFVVNSVHVGHPSHRSTQTAQKEFAAQKMKATAWLDDGSGELGRDYGLKTTPHMVVIDHDGIVVYNGAIDNKAETDGDPRKAENYVRATLNSLAAGVPVEISKTKPYGCSIKYK